MDGNRAKTFKWPLLQPNRHGKVKSICCTSMPSLTLSPDILSSDSTSCHHAVDLVTKLQFQLMGSVDAKYKKRKMKKKNVDGTI